MHVNVGILCGVLRNVSDFLVEALRETLHQCGASRQHDVVVQTNFEIGIAVLDRLVGDICNACWFMVMLTCIGILQDVGREDDLSRLKALLVSHLDNLTTGQLV